MKLITKRLILRDWEKKDKKDLIENINNLKVSKWLLLVPYPYNKKDADKFLNKKVKDNKIKDKKNYYFAIFLKEERKVIGGIAIRDKFQEKAKVGYWLGEKYWKKGYGSEALAELLRFAFNKLKLRRIEAGVFVGNPSSGKLLEKFGAKLEGKLRKIGRCKANGKIMDENFYGLLKEEWRNKNLK